MIVGNTATVSLTIAEWREFAGFTVAEQDYIERALDIGLARCDAIHYWARGAGDRAMLREHCNAYHALPSLRKMLLSGPCAEDIDIFLAPLLCMAAFDLAQNRLESFGSFRFLYERLMGAAARPWLPSVFCAAAALPQIRPERRKILLRSLSEAAATAPAWSDDEPRFYPGHLDDAVA
ncbi:hypothetical protein D6851_13430 [Altericroceibacterium spongiae]|uniref:Uncharacterized protein n=1 Tax=Altericroceibacterium spongiae TaxID=2320269 RepID=A0A420EEC6_9SPHN|nr:hypothetical protein [Altericroceibacterium spongiae]RKF19020.1 hypothetical protein D6851_13430 [Altericroceibacterium spongiae]